MWTYLEPEDAVDLSVVGLLAINFARAGLTDLMLMQVCWQGWSDFKIMIEQVLEKAP